MELRQLWSGQLAELPHSVSPSLSLSVLLSPPLSLSPHPHAPQSPPCGLPACTSLGFLTGGQHRGQRPVVTAAQSSSTSIPGSQVKTASSFLSSLQTCHLLWVTNETLTLPDPTRVGSWPLSACVPHSSRSFPSSSASYGRPLNPTSISMYSRRG